MIDLQFVRFPKKPILTILLGALLVFASHLFVKTRINEARALAPQGCSTFIGPTWRLASNPNATWAIRVEGEFNTLGTYNVPGHANRKLTGTISTNRYTGDWSDGQRRGRFVAVLFPSIRTIRVTFYENHVRVDSADWVCGQTARPTPTPYTPTVTATPTPTPFPLATPTPVPSPNWMSIRDDVDVDNFQTFDSLDSIEQQKVLIQRGPRSPKEYSANDLNMRVLVRSGWPVALDYGLSNTDFATLTIQITGFKPDHIRLEPRERNQVRLILRDWRSDEIRVARIHVETSSPDGDFRIYGFGMGEHAAQAVQRGTGDISGLLLAMNNANGNSSASLPRSLLPQVGTSVDVSVTLPSSLQLGQSPKQRIEFRCVTNSDFSQGRWEWWRVNGTRWEKVWEKKTGGITRNQPKSERWDGIITSARKDSIGYHSLSISVWQKTDQPEWVAARTDPALQVFR